MTYILLLNDSWIEFEVNVFDSLQIDPAQIRIAAGSIHELLSLIKDLDDARFVLQTFHILVAVSITTLQNFYEFLIEALNH